MKKLSEKEYLELQEKVHNEIKRLEESEELERKNWLRRYYITAILGNLLLIATLLLGYVLVNN